MALGTPNNDTSAQGTCGTVVWRVDGDGTLVFAPLPGRGAGVFAPDLGRRDPAEKPAWSRWSKRVKRARVDGPCRVSGSARSMFQGCESLFSLDLSGLDTSRVTDMSGMFWGCEALRSLDLSGLDTSKVTDMSHMFDGCYGLSTFRLPESLRRA